VGNANVATSFIDVANYIFKEFFIKRDYNLFRIFNLTKQI